MKRPKCSYERQQTDVAPDWQCPSCKVAYVKALQAQNLVPKPIEVCEHSNDSLIHLIKRDVERDEEEPPESLWLASKGQKMVIYSILLNLLLSAAERNHVMPDTVNFMLTVCIAVYALVGVVRICSGLGKTQNQKILFMVMAFFPLINVLALVYLSAKTTKVLREAGWKVGLLGAKS
jgi:hypothetical protein